MPAGKDSKLTLGEVLKKAAGRSEKARRSLRLPELPESMFHVWQWYHSVKRGSQPLTWQELEAWSRMNATPLTADTAEALMAIDDAILRVARNAH